jgi:hypothetical protein
LDHDELVKKVPQTNFLPKLMQNFSPFSKVAQYFDYFSILKKCKKANKHPVGEKSHNLVTLMEDRVIRRNVEKLHPHHVYPRVGGQFYDLVNT